MAILINNIKLHFVHECSKESDSFVEYLLNPSFGQNFGYSKDVYSSIVSLLITRGVFSINLKQHLRDSIEQNIENSEYVVAVFDVLDSPTVRIDDKGIIVYDKIDKEILMKDSLNNYKFFAQLCKQTKYILFCQAIKSDSNFHRIAFNMFNQDEASKCISAILMDFSESKNIKEIVFIEQYIPILPLSDINIILNIAKENNSPEVSLKINSILNLYFFRNEKIGFDWFDWWSKNKDKFNREEEALMVLKDLNLDHEVHESAIFFLVFPIKKELPTSTLKIIEKFAEGVNSKQTKVLIQGVFGRYNQIFTGNPIVNSILKKTGK